MWLCYTVAFHKLKMNLLSTSPPCRLPFLYRTYCFQSLEYYSRNIAYIYIYAYISIWKWKVKVLVAQLCLTLWDPMDCSPPGSSVHGILQARILDWLAISFSRGSSRPSDWTQVSCIAGRFFTVWATREALSIYHLPIIVPSRAARRILVP